MTIQIVVGGQFGSEGKGKVAGYLAKEVDLSIRTGGPNAGHTVESGGTFFKVQSVPCAFVNPTAKLAIGSGGVIDPVILQREVEVCRIPNASLMIDPQAVIIKQEYSTAEKELMTTIGSTGKGVGEAVLAKIRRDGSVLLAKNYEPFHKYIGHVAELANGVLDQGGKVFLEGTQGFGLSLHHGIYPFVTSRDTSAAAFLSEAGLSPLSVDEIYLVIRTYPIRVGGNSGPIVDEIDWETVTSESNSDSPLIEYTTVTKKIRRVARFDIALVKEAVRVNRPTKLALNFIDYINREDSGKTNFDLLSKQSKDFIDKLESATGVEVGLIGTGPRNVDIIDRRSSR